MTYNSFQFWREQYLRINPGTLDCAETNLYRSLSTLRPPAVSAGNDKVHRCDLARAWLARYGLPEKYSQRALICRGVRHALSLIFRELAGSHAKIWIPKDVYPVYVELAQMAGNVPVLFTTLPEPVIPTDPPSNLTEYLLIANPWKPLGRYLTDQECDGLFNWLNASSSRFLLVDCAYDLGIPFHPTTQKLHETGRAVLLHSATKGWLWPKTFGVALVSDNRPAFELAFHQDPPSPEQLKLATVFLSRHAHCPDLVTRDLEKRAKNLLSIVPAEVKKSFLLEPSRVHPGCYFFSARIPAEQLLHSYKLLAIPASVFGSTWSGSVITTLSPAFMPDTQASSL